MQWARLQQYKPSRDQRGSAPIVLLCALFRLGTEERRFHFAQATRSYLIMALEDYGGDLDSFLHDMVARNKHASALRLVSQDGKVYSSNKAGSALADEASKALGGTPAATAAAAETPAERPAATMASEKEGSTTGAGSLDERLRVPLCNEDAQLLGGLLQEVSAGRQSEDTCSAENQALDFGDYQTLEGFLFEGTAGAEALRVNVPDLGSFRLVSREEFREHALAEFSELGGARGMVMDSSQSHILLVFFDPGQGQDVAITKQLAWGICECLASYDL